jgi:hypothetical protein
VHVLTKQVDEITAGSVSKKSMLISLAIGVSLSLGLSMVRVLTGISIWYFVLPVYVIAIILTFIAPPIFSGIAFDSGGVAAGSMASAFLLPMGIGACVAVNGNVLTDAFGLVGFVAMTPLVTIQLLGLVYKYKAKKQEEKKHAVLDFPKESIAGLGVSDKVVEFDEDYDDEIVDFDTDSEDMDIDIEDIDIKDINVEDIDVEDIDVEDIDVEDIDVEDIDVEDIDVEIENNKEIEEERKKETESEEVMENKEIDKESKSDENMGNDDNQDDCKK